MTLETWYDHLPHWVSVRPGAFFRATRCYKGVYGTGRKLLLQPRCSQIHRYSDVWRCRGGNLVARLVNQRHPPPKLPSPSSIVVADRETNY